MRGQIYEPGQGTPWRLSYSRLVGWFISASGTELWMKHTPLSFVHNLYCSTDRIIIYVMKYGVKFEALDLSVD